MSPVLGPATIQQRHRERERRESSVRDGRRGGPGGEAGSASPFQNPSLPGLALKESIQTEPANTPANVAAEMLKGPLSSGQASLGSTGSSALSFKKEPHPLGSAEPESTAPPCCLRAFEGQEVDPAEAQGCVDSFGNTSLMWAASVGNTRAVQQLLPNSDDINAANKNGVTALQVAVRHTHHEVVDLLLHAGADPTLKNTSRGMTALHYAVLCADPRAMILKLLKSQGYAELSQASQLSDQKASKLQGQQQEMESEGSPTAAKVAVRHTHHEVVDLLLHAGADPTLKNTSRGMTALHYAVLCADPRAMILKLLKSQGYAELSQASQLSDQKASKLQGQQQEMESEGSPTAAKVAGGPPGTRKGLANGPNGSLKASRGNDLSVEVGDDQQEDADPEAAAQSKEAARKAAKAAMIKEEEEENQWVQMQQEHKRVQQHLSRFLETLDALGQSALVLAINQARMEAMDTLQQANASAHTRLHFAAQHGHDAAVKELLRSGAPPDEPDTEGITPVMKASKNGHGAVLSTLLREKADLHRKVPGTDLTCILLASSGKHFSALVQLIDHGARIEDRGARGNTPILLASAAGSLPIMQHLIKCGADVDVANEDQDTPLHVAARGGFTGSAADQSFACCHILTN
ncbi:ankyrin repeat-containing domain protein [Dunaliella salina]|uniref:Ankyrin repeat-containing domain protein n=1 Tax=Dunaliella salina TaxID=3046 RepID=A0ABQ7H2B6_DUNSA|nr:ankyrin repeat-containing domain protein [Dunaliella salina]|eukprot:KAF5841001.1 ankyrin repeat-containing domain protein [Dunaliella salina]